MKANKDRPTRLRTGQKPRSRFMSGGTSIADSPIDRRSDQVAQDSGSDVELDSMIQSLEGRLAQLESWRMDDDVSTPGTAKSEGKHNQLAASIRGMLENPNASARSRNVTPRDATDNLGTSSKQKLRLEATAEETEEFCGGSATSASAAANLNTSQSASGRHSKQPANGNSKSPAGGQGRMSAKSPSSSSGSAVAIMGKKGVADHASSSQETIVIQEQNERMGQAKQEELKTSSHESVSAAAASPSESTAAPAESPPSSSPADAARSILPTMPASPGAAPELPGLRAMPTHVNDLRQGSSRQEAQQWSTGEDVMRERGQRIREGEQAVPATSTSPRSKSGNDLGRGKKDHVARASPGGSVNLSVSQLHGAMRNGDPRARLGMGGSGARKGESQDTDGASNTGMFGTLKNGFYRLFTATPVARTTSSAMEKSTSVLESVDASMRASTESLYRSRKRTASFETLAGHRGPQQRESRSCDPKRTYAPPPRVISLEPPATQPVSDPPLVERFTMASRPGSAMSRPDRSTGRLAGAHAGGAANPITGSATICRNLLTDTTTVLTPRNGVNENNAEALQRRVGRDIQASAGAGAPTRRSLLTEQTTTATDVGGRQCPSTARQCGEAMRNRADDIRRNCARKSHDCTEGAKACQEEMHKIDTQLRDRKENLTRHCARHMCNLQESAKENTRKCMYGTRTRCSNLASATSGAARTCAAKSDKNAKECMAKTSSNAKECGASTAKAAKRCCELPYLGFSAAKDGERRCTRDCVNLREDVAFLSNLSTFFNISHVKVWTH
ncbi:unnamed protein product [Amoebophrya sp. A120]|nr:unnamed protein product [Amoebophrya sp. A120]|eukprot:GSA120T00020241001.1